MLTGHPKIDALDLDPIIVKAMDKEEGYGWSVHFAQRVATEYKRYLTLCLENPDFPIVPSTFVDDFWHHHILDTQKYQLDCERIFGYFLHHFPYFGMRGETDAQNLKAAWEQSCELYRKRFGELDQELWPQSNRCPNCGRRCRNANALLSEGRPTLISAA